MQAVRGAAAALVDLVADELRTMPAPAMSEQERQAQHDHAFARQNRRRRTPTPPHRLIH